MNTSKVTSSGTILMSMAIVAAGFVFKTFYPSAPYETLVWATCGLAGGYFAKRTVQKTEKFSYTLRNGGSGGSNTTVNHESVPSG